MNCENLGNAAPRDLFFHIDLSATTVSEVVAIQIGKIEKESSLLNRVMICTSFKQPREAPF